MTNSVAARRLYSEFAYKTSAAHVRPLLEAVRDHDFTTVLLLPGRDVFFDDGKNYIGIVSDDLTVSDKPQSFWLEALR